MIAKDDALFSVNREQPGSASHSTNQQWRSEDRHFYAVSAKTNEMHRPTISFATLFG